MSMISRLRSGLRGSVAGVAAKSFYLPGPAATLAIGLLSCLVVGELQAYRFTVSGLSELALTIVLPVCGAAYAWRREMDPRLISVLACICAMTVVVLLAAVLQYPFTAHGAKGLLDHDLLAADKMLGLDPIGFVAFFDGYKLACDILLFFYCSMGTQAFILLAIYVFTRDFNGVDAFLMTIVILITVSSVIASAFPAIGFTGILDVSFQNTDVLGGRSGQPAFLALRSGALRNVDLSELRGLITFPSGHASFAVLATLAAARTRFAFWPFLVTNILVLVSSIIHGGHYFCDLIAGGTLAAAAWPIAVRLAEWRPKRAAFLLWAAPTRSVQLDRSAAE